MDESRYQRLAEQAFRRIEDGFAEVDPSDVDFESAGDVLTLTLRDGVKCIVNTQRPTRQIWLAARSRAYHFGFDEASATWRDDKDATLELFAALQQIVRDGSKMDVVFAKSVREK